MKILFMLLVATHSIAAISPTATKKALQGKWDLVGLTCNGVSQALDKEYAISFEKEKGTYISKTAKCTQFEPEIYEYLKDGKISIKSGVRACSPNPCEADLPADQCGKETNAQTPVFDVSINGEKMTLSTSDPKSIDCTGAGQKKPAVFTFVKQTRKR